MATSDALTPAAPVGGSGEAEARALLRGVRRMVVKVGSRIVAERPEVFAERVATELAAVRGRGVEVVLVSSGAIALGVAALGLSERPRDMPGLQAAAAVGQGRLMHLYEQAFGARGITVGQVLLTHEDLRSRQRFLNARRAFGALLGYGALPIINENDTVAVEEIKFGDNDELAALVSNVVEADLLTILTDVDGLYDGVPSEGASFISLVRDIETEAAPVAGGAGSAVSRGGMASKVRAAKVAGRLGLPTVVASGQRAGVLTTILDGGAVGTLFLPATARLGSRKAWIAYALRPSGGLVVDDGAKRALLQGGKSLLPSGIREVRGAFLLGDAVAVYDEQGNELARGLVSYDAADCVRVAGHHSNEIEAILGYRTVDEIVHRDDLVLV
jgi:glutamate 5-kinase